jgi:hypothetical protein
MYLNCSECRVSWIWSTWAKAPFIESQEVLVASACLPVVNPRLFEELSRGRVVLLACPERESAAYYGKLASIIRSTRPRRLVVVTIDGSPHCFALQASVNEAEYILGERVEREHYVVVDGVELKKISPNAIRVARYLSIVNDVVESNPAFLRELEKHSKEYRHSIRLTKTPQ